MPLSAYPIDPQLTGLLISHMNMPTDYIANTIAPYRPVESRLFEWDQFSIDEMFTPQGGPVGRLSKTDDVTFGATRITSSTANYGLSSPVPFEDINNQDIGYDVLSRHTEGLSALIQLDREVRVAAKVQNLATYPASQRVTLSGTSQWSDYTNSTPLASMLAALDIPLLRPNAMIMSQSTWTVLRRHPNLVQASKPASVSGQGTISLAELAEVLEIDQILLGKARRNTAKPGQPAVMGRLWGKGVAAVYINPAAQLQGVATEPTFMLTPRFGTPVTNQEPVAPGQMGLYGGIRVTAGESVAELVQSTQGAYYWEAAVA